MKANTIDENDIEFQKYLKKRFDDFKTKLMEKNGNFYSDDGDFDVEGMSQFLFMILRLVFDAKPDSSHMPLIMFSTVDFNQSVANFIKRSGVHKDVKKIWQKGISEAISEGLY